MGPVPPSPCRAPARAPWSAAARVWSDWSPGESAGQIEAAGYEAVEVPEFGHPGPGPWVRGRPLRPPPGIAEIAERPVTGPSGWSHDDRFPGGAWVLEDAAG